MFFMAYRESYRIFDIVTGKCHQMLLVFIRIHNNSKTNFMLCVKMRVYAKNITNNIIAYWKYSEQQEDEHQRENLLWKIMIRTSRTNRKSLVFLREEKKMKPIKTPTLLNSRPLFMLFPKIPMWNQLPYLQDATE